MKITHPSFERMARVAAAMGSTAATVRGVAKFLRGNVRAKSAIQAAVCGNPRKLHKHDWQAAVTSRKANPEAKRARDDRKFRKGYLAKLRKQEAIRLSFDGSTIAGIAAYLDSQAAREKYLLEIACLRTIATGKRNYACQPKQLPPAPATVTIPIDETTARKLGASIIMRGKDATLTPCRAKSHGNHADAYTDWSKGSSKPRGVRAVHDNYVRSFGLIVSPQRIEAIFHETQIAVELPDGYTWDIDANGLRAVDANSRRDDYHPSAAELLRKDAAAYLVAKINANRETRQRMAAQIAVEAAAVAGVYVCLADSLRAGNCRQGTLNFGQRHGLDPGRHYSAPDLLAMANGDASRVRLAVTAARLRHEREMVSGVCELADHRC